MLFILEVLVEVAGEHTVVELAHLICTLTVEALEGGVRGDDIHLPGCERAEVRADVAVERLSFFLRA